jgi:hypothetical protein
VCNQKLQSTVHGKEFYEIEKEKSVILWGIVLTKSLKNGFFWLRELKKVE